jgi:hypothetical protein
LLKSAKPKVQQVIPPPEDQKTWENHGKNTGKVVVCGCCVFLFTKDVRYAPYISKIYVKYVCVYGEYMEIWQEVEVELHSHIGCGDDGDVWVKSGHFIQW